MASMSESFDVAMTLELEGGCSSTVSSGVLAALNNVLIERVTFLQSLETGALLFAGWFIFDVCYIHRSARYF